MSKTSAFNVDTTLLQGAALKSLNISFHDLNIKQRPYQRKTENDRLKLLKSRIRIFGFRQIVAYVWHIMTGSELVRS